MKITYNSFFEDLMDVVRDSQQARRGIKRVALSPAEVEALKDDMRKLGHEWRELPCQCLGVQLVTMDQEIEILKEDGVAT